MEGRRRWRLGQGTTGLCGLGDDAARDRCGLGMLGDDAGRGMGAATIGR